MNSGSELSAVIERYIQSENENSNELINYLNRIEWNLEIFFCLLDYVPKIKQVSKLMLLVKLIEVATKK